jgi:hypothetical protein
MLEVFICRGGAQRNSNGHHFDSWGTVREAHVFSRVKQLLGLPR